MCDKGGSSIQSQNQRGRREEETGDTKTYSMCTTHTNTQPVHSQSPQVVLAEVQQICWDTAAGLTWRWVYTKLFPEPGHVSAAVTHYKHKQAFSMKHTVKHLFVISQHNKMPLPLEVKAGLISGGLLICGTSVNSPKLYDINTLWASQLDPNTELCSAGEMICL